MDIATPFFSILQAVVSVVLSGLSDGGSALFGVATQCSPDTCPGSFYTAIATAWANIGYLTHADVLNFILRSNFGSWAILLYIGAAVTALIGVATNSPMRNWTWFFIGPALYSFLVATPHQVQGVNWVVANRSQPMEEVWRNAEAGLANTRIARDRRGVTINGVNGPQGQYEVAMPMVFLDELFSATTNLIIEWTGIGHEVQGTGGRSNLAQVGAGATGATGEGPWWLLSTLKWGFVENITSNTLRDPSVRDALVTFLSSECGDKFKEVIDSGAYIAATQARGAIAVDTVLSSGTAGDGPANLAAKLSTTVISTPRSLASILRQGKGTVGSSFGDFVPQARDAAVNQGRSERIVCSEYLWTVVQALRFEAGSAYYQLLRSSPRGINQENFVRTLLYGWDVRTGPNSVNVATPTEQQAFLKHLILAYIVRNELLYAPQITSVDQRFAPAEQARSYSDSYVKTFGSKQKFIELYNAAVMMPYLQGILAYFLIIAYPIACMLVILPGHYKGFLTWVSFFAWVKLWDVGFALVQVIERSVWAMVGNHAHLASTAQVLLDTAKKNGGIGVTSPTHGLAADPDLKGLDAVPFICSLKAGTLEQPCGPGGNDQTFTQAFDLLDKLLLTSANLDLDLSNGWYIYIMSALYLAVPAVTGQLVLGAKAGSAGMIKEAFQGVGQDGGNAAKTGFQHAAVNALMNNSSSLEAAVAGKAMSKSGHAGKAFDLRKQALDHGSNDNLMGNKLNAEEKAGANMAAKTQDYREARKLLGEGLNLFQEKKGGPNNPGLTDGGGQVPQNGSTNRTMFQGAGSNLGFMQPFMAGAGTVLRAGKNMALSTNGRAAMMAEENRLNYADGVRQSRGRGLSADTGWDRGYEHQAVSAKNAYAGSLDRVAESDARAEVWDAKAKFGAHVSAMAGIAGMNSGSLQAGQKPHDANYLGMTGQLDTYSGPSGDVLLGSGKQGALADSAKTQDVYGNAHYAGNGFLSHLGDVRETGKATRGKAFVDQAYSPTGPADLVTKPVRNVGDWISTASQDPVAALNTLFGSPVGNGAANLTEQQERQTNTRSGKGTSKLDELIKK